MNQQIFLCRHGETSWTLTGQHTGISDIPLIKTGKEQALALGKKLKSISFEKVLCSPLKRAQETCQLAGFGACMETEPLAVEWDYGSYEGLTQKQILEKTDQWGLFDFGAPGGESPKQIGERADALLKKLSHQTGNILLFSHGHFLRVFAARFLMLPVSQGKLFLLSVTSMSILGFERANPVIKLWNECNEQT